MPLDGPLLLFFCCGRGEHGLGLHRLASLGILLSLFCAVVCLVFLFHIEADIVS